MYFARTYNELKETLDATNSVGFHDANTSKTTPFKPRTTLPSKPLQTEGNWAIRGPPSALCFGNYLIYTTSKFSQVLAITSTLKAEVHVMKKGAAGKTKHLKNPVMYDKDSWTHGVKCSHTSKDCNRRVGT